MTALPPRVLFLARHPQRRARLSFEGLYVGFIVVSLLKLLKYGYEIRFYDSVNTNIASKKNKTNPLNILLHIAEVFYDNCGR